MKITKIHIGIVAIISVLAFLSVAFVPKVLGGAISLEGPAGLQGGSGRIVNYTFFAATTTTAVSTNVNASIDADGRYDTGTLNVAGAKRVTFYFQRGDVSGQGNTGKSVFDVDVSPDGTTWVSFNRLIENNVTSTATTTVTINAATSTEAFSLDLTNHTFKAIRCGVTETTDGEHTCKATAEF